MSQNSGTSMGGIGFLGALAIVFITLQLTHVIDWPWWAVLLPLWGPLVAVAAIFVVAIVFIGLDEALRK